MPPTPHAPGSVCQNCGASRLLADTSVPCPSCGFRAVAPVGVPPGIPSAPVASPATPRRGRAHAGAAVALLLVLLVVGLWVVVPLLGHPLLGDPLGLGHR